MAFAFRVRNQKSNIKEPVLKLEGCSFGDGLPLAPVTILLLTLPVFQNGLT